VLPASISWRVAVAAGALSFAAAMASGLWPALQVSKDGAPAALRDASLGATSRLALRRLFVTAQVALSLALAVEAGLFARATARAGVLDPGYDGRGVELTDIDLSMGGDTDSSAPSFWRNLAERARALPGVEAAVVAKVVPGGFESFGAGFSVPDRPQATDGFDPSGNIVGPGYFATLRIPITAGRDFTYADTTGAPPVVIVGERAAKHFWPGRSPLGMTLSRRTQGGVRLYRVVGVAKDIRSTTLIDGLAQSFVYLPLEQAEEPGLTASLTLVTRTAAGSAAADVRALVAGMEPRLPPVSTRSVDDSVSLGLVPQRVAVALAGSLGTLGLVLAALGVYGLTAFTVARREREFGIRTALGAMRSEILRLVLRQGLGPVVCGCVMGVLLAAAVARVLGGFLLGLPALDLPA